MSPSALQTLAVIFPVSDYALQLFRSHFATVHYYPNGDIPNDVAAESEVWYCTWTGLPKGIEFKSLGNTQIVQLTSAGANLALKHPALQSPEARKQISVCSASGIHVLSIPTYIVGTIVNLYFNLQRSIVITETEGRWPSRTELAYRAASDVTKVDGDNRARSFGLNGFKTLRGKTAGLLGYGHIGRETARLLQALGLTIVAANTSGTRTVDDGYIIDGTGDKEGTIPTAYYNTRDPISFKEFLTRSDILIASLPSTPATTFMLQPEHFAALPNDALFINVGRGDLVKSDIILEALEAPRGLLGVGLDVTDPEPLPQGHALLTHRRAIITPHISADIEGYFDAGADLLIANVARVRAGGKPMNVVDHDKGY